MGEYIVPIGIFHTTSFPHNNSMILRTTSRNSTIQPTSSDRQILKQDLINLSDELLNMNLHPICRLMKRHPDGKAIMAIASNGSTAPLAFEDTIQPISSQRPASTIVALNLFIIPPNKILY